jgi:hypothetical protein
MTLENWLENKWLGRHTTSAREIADLFTMVDRDLKDASIASVSTDWRLIMAFNASLQCATIALHACGYRAIGEGHHERIINSLRFTINAPPELIRQLNRFRGKRIKGSYDSAGITSEQEVREAIDFTKALRAKVRQWLEKSHPELA